MLFISVFPPFSFPGSTSQGSLRFSASDRCPEKVCKVGLGTDRKKEKKEEGRSVIITENAVG